MKAWMQMAVICLVAATLVFDGEAGNPRAIIKFDVKLGNLRTDSLLKFLSENKDRLARAIKRDASLVIRGEGNAAFYEKDGGYVMGATFVCRVRDDHSQGILKEFKILVETTENLGQALGKEILNALERQ